MNQILEEELSSDKEEQHVDQMVQMLEEDWDRFGPEGCAEDVRDADPERIKTCRRLAWRILDELRELVKVGMPQGEEPWNASTRRPTTRRGKDLRRRLWTIQEAASAAGAGPKFYYE